MSYPQATVSSPQVVTLVPPTSAPSLAPSAAAGAGSSSGGGSSGGGGLIAIAGAVVGVLLLVGGGIAIAKCRYKMVILQSCKSKSKGKGEKVGDLEEVPRKGSGAAKVHVLASSDHGPQDKNKGLDKDKDKDKDKVLDKGLEKGLEKVKGKGKDAGKGALGVVNEVPAATTTTTVDKTTPIKGLEKGFEKVKGLDDDEMTVGSVSGTKTKKNKKRKNNQSTLSTVNDAALPMAALPPAGKSSAVVAVAGEEEAKDR